MRLTPRALAGSLILSVCSLALMACSGEDTGATQSTTTNTGGGGTGTAGSSTSTGAASGGGTGGTGGTTTTGSGGSTPGDGSCPTGQFQGDKQVVLDSSMDDIASDTTWTKDKLYIVKTEVTVRALLTIEAGTTVCFDEVFTDSGSLVVAPYGDGALDIKGTPAEHVTLTAVDGSKGWPGILVHGGAEKLSITFADFHYSSNFQDAPLYYHSHGAVKVGGGVDEPAPVAHLDHVTFSNLKRGGAVWLTGGAGISPDSFIEVLSYNLNQPELQYADSAVLVTLDDAASLAPGMIALSAEVPESKAGVELLREPMRESVVLPALDVPYLAPDGIFAQDDGTNVDPYLLTISAGAEIRMGSNASVWVGAGSFGDKANLIIDGTAEKPVLFTYYPFPDSFQPTGSWAGIAFDDYDPGVSRISYAILQTAGGGVEDVNTACNTDERGAILLYPPTLSDYPPITVDHTTIDGSITNGIVAECDFECIDASADYMDPALGNTFVNITKKPQILATCPP